MVVVPLPNPANSPEPVCFQLENNQWLRVAAGGSLIAGALLLLNGKPRSALIAALAGTSLAMLTQQETVRTWWNELPGLVDDAGRMMSQVQGVMENLEKQREKLRAIVQK